MRNDACVRPLRRADLAHASCAARLPEGEEQGRLAGAHPGARRAEGFQRAVGKVGEVLGANPALRQRGVLLDAVAQLGALPR